MRRGRARVLVEAYECSPIKGHAAGGAWRILTSLSKWFELWVITEETQYRDEISMFLEENPEIGANLHFLFIPRCYAPSPPKPRSIVPVREVLSYRKWLASSYALANHLHVEIRFDIAHHLRGNSFREPGFLWRLPIPFIWGPTGGSNLVPWQLLRGLPCVAQAAHVAKNVINMWQFRFGRNVRHAAHRAVSVFAQSKRDKDNFWRIHGVDARFVQEHATQPVECNYRRYDSTRKLNVVWVGRCIALKGLPVVLEAIANPSIRGRVLLHVVGDGPCRRAWERRAMDLGVADNCIWYGWQSQEEVASLLNKCDVLAFSALMEGTPTTVKQALSCGLPIIALEHCGFNEILTTACGIPVPVGSLDSVVRGFTRALLSLISEPSRIEVMSVAASRLASSLSWNGLVRQIQMAYQTALLLGTK